MKPLNSIEEILADIAAGRMVVIMDDEDRENEGDLVMAAQKVRAEDINFMARFGRGLICLTLTAERCKQLRLPLMVSETHREHRTNFTLSIEAAEGVTTGISAHDRAHTVITAVKPDARPEDLRQPGHIFPVMAQPGGVLTRAGHTEAGCDLARLAGLDASAVIVEIMNDDGTMARRPDLEEFATCIWHWCAASSIPSRHRWCACIPSTPCPICSECRGRDAPGRCATRSSASRRWEPELPSYCAITVRRASWPMR
jgi:3,4-dihydroxy 2-butanone 4-phosphate synthase/GTP cyclohydrolase II